MTFKSILAPLAPSEDKQAGAEFAVSMAEALGARVTACAYALYPEALGLGVSWFPKELIQSHLGKVTKAAQAAGQKLSAVAKRAKVEISTEIVRLTLPQATASFAEYARVHDVSVLTQSSPGLEHAGDLFAEAALFHSGRPLILVPKDYSTPFYTDRILIAWDGSQHAARAVSHAMPMLALAKKIEILVVGNKEKLERSRASKLATNLECHGFDVELIGRNRSDDAGEIAREAKLWRASLLVMGGYGHSRARELFFGGVTRYMVTNAPVPVLMAY
jgi:nucleotide-binding universal stress UspA family protein